MENKLLKSLQFQQNDLWDSVMSIVDNIINTEVEIAMSQELSDSVRAHQCGRADGARAVKIVLQELYNQANSERFTPKKQ